MHLRALLTFCSSSERIFIHLYSSLSSRLVNYVQKSVGHPLQGEVSQVTLLTRPSALADNIRDRNQIKYGEGRVNNVKSVESSVTKVALCVRPSVSICRMCFSACPFRARGSSVCVHVVVGCFRGSSQRGRRLRFGGGFLVSALIEQHVGCFSHNLVL